MKPRRFSYRALALLGLMLTTACQQISTIVYAANPHPEPVRYEAGLRLGAILPTTDITVGQPMLQALSAIVQKVNTCGGINSASVSLYVNDDEMNPTLGTAAATHLIQDTRVNAIVGAFADDVSRAVLNVTVPSRVLLISPGSTSPWFTARAQQGAFQGFWARTVSSTTNQARALAKLAIDRGWKKVSTLVVNTDDGIRFEAAFVTAFSELGGTVLNRSKPTRHIPKALPEEIDNEAIVAFSPTKTNGSILKPDAVVALLDAATGDKVIRAASDLGLLNGVRMMLAEEDPAAFLERVGKTANEKYILAGAIGTLPTVHGAASASLQQLWTDKTGDSLPVYVPQTWDAAALVMLAAQAAHSNDSQAIASKLRDVANPGGIEVRDICDGLKLLRQGRKINYQGASGTVDLNAQGDVVGSYDVWTATAQGTIDVIDHIQPGN